MRRFFIPAFLAGLAVLAGLLILGFSSLNAQSKPVTQIDRTPSAPGTANLPISQVVLFSSGVGMFQREGEVEGDARVDLTFPITDVNDLLKSMVLQDLGGGVVSAVSYDSHDPVEKTLQSFAINLNGNPTLGNILNQARGEKVEVILQQSSVSQPGTLTGTIVGLEKQKLPIGKDALQEMEVLNLWCADGLRSVRLSELQRLRFLNPAIEAEFKRALETLALSHDTKKKAVSLRFNGEGKRPVRVSYVVESPIWKTTYRLVLDKNKRPFLQGWAVVENTTDADWNNVRVALISGRPISFRMDLYSPLYVPRPMVEPELFASLRPPTYSGSMTEKEALRRNINEPKPMSAAERLSEDAKRGAMKSRLEPGERRREEQLALGMVVDSTVARDRDLYGFAQGELKSLEVSRGVSSAAAAIEIGDSFQYLIEKPVTLPRQKSAMLPIVNEAVDGTRVSIYNQATHAKFPLLGLRFRNSSGLHLMQGPITVFDGSSYAGDARIQDLQPNEDRLLSYAIDLGMEVETGFESEPGKLTAVKIVKGIAYTTHKLREHRTWNIKNRTDQERALVLEHPYRSEYQLVSPKEASERSRDVYRFDVKVPAGQTVKHEVIEERNLDQSVHLTNQDDESIKILLTSTVASPKVKAALEKAQSLRNQVAATQRELAQVNEDLKQISEDQSRLRANLREMPPTAAAYKRYLEKFDKQESEIEKLQSRLKELQVAVNQQQAAFDHYLAGLEVE